MGLWVLGTDTDVGKTVTSALILQRYADSGSVAYWKPISTGGDDDRDRTTVSALVGPSVTILAETYILEPPVSPHLAARLANVRIDPEAILADLVEHAMSDDDRVLLIESAGGVLVPLTDDGYLSIRLVQESTLPVVVVARSTLGTINHTLLTLEALRARNIEIVAVVVNGPKNAENRRAIEKYGRVATLEVPVLSSTPPSRTVIAKAALEFDPESLLAPFFLDDKNGDS